MVLNFDIDTVMETQHLDIAFTFKIYYDIIINGHLNKLSPPENWNVS